MIFRILILFALVILAGCDQKTDKTTSKATVAGPVSITTYSVFDSTLTQKFFDTRFAQYGNDIQKVLDAVNALSAKAQTLKDDEPFPFKVCFSNVDDVVTRHPCSLDSALLVNVVKKMNYEDSLKGFRVKLETISFAQSISDDNPIFSKIILNDDGSLESVCASKDGKKCDALYARVAVFKKFSMKNFLEEDGSTWVPERYYVRIDENEFSNEFEMDSLLSSIFERSLKHFYLGNEVDSLIPFEMCYENGFAIPCGMTPKDLALVKETVKNYGDTLIAVTYQKSPTMFAFVHDGMSSKHFCKSLDGTHCSELYALVREKNEKLEKFCKKLEEKNTKPICAGAMDLCDAIDSRMALFRFSTKDFYATKEKLSHGDMAPNSDGGLYKKDGTYLGREKAR